MLKERKRIKRHIIFIFVLFLFTSLHFYSFWIYTIQINKYEEIFEKYSYDILYQNVLVNDINEKTNILFKDFLILKENHQLLSKNINSKVDVLDSAINSKSKRWENIKKVRNIIKETIAKNKGIGSPLNIIEMTRYSSAVVDYSSEYDVPIPLILAVTRQESAFNPRAISHAGARGLMQLMPETAKECSSKIGKRNINLFHIRNNVQLGTFYLREMLTKFNENVLYAIRAYNAGPTYVSKVLANEYSSYPEETIDYSKKVIKYLKEYKLNY